jgi:hypothetical protein
VDGVRQWLRQSQPSSDRTLAQPTTPADHACSTSGGRVCTTWWRTVEGVELPSVPLVPHYLSPSGWAAEGVLRFVDHIHEGERLVVAPQPENLCRSAQSVCADRPAAIKEVDMLVVTISTTAVAEEGVQAPAVSPHALIRRLVTLLRVPEHKCRREDSILLSAGRSRTRHHTAHKAEGNRCGQNLLHHLMMAIGTARCLPRRGSFANALHHVHVVEFDSVTVVIWNQPELNRQVALAPVRPDLRMER